MGVHVKVAGAWQEIAAPDAGFAWAKVTGGTVTEYTKGDGSVMEVHTFTAGGTLTVENAGYAEVLLVGGGAGGAANVFNGGGGSIVNGLHALPSGAHAVAVGAGGVGGAANGENELTYGKVSSIGSIVASTTSYIYHGSGASNADNSLPFTSSIDGTSKTYGLKGQASPRANRGDGGNLSNSNGSSGVVVVAVQKSAALPLPPAGSWAKITGGTVVEVVNGDGSVDEVHTFTADGTLTVESPGYARVFVLSGAAGGRPGIASGDGGRFRDGLHSLPAGAVPVVVGAGGPSGATTDIFYGRSSSLGSIYSPSPAASYMGAGARSGLSNTSEGFVSDITGTSVEYGRSQQPSPIPNRGEGHADGTGSSGVVIVRVQKTAPTVSGVVATGGAVNDYTGDGTNGVLGQKYRVHTFTADGSLVVSQGGVADVLLISGGSAVWTTISLGGGGGTQWEGRITLGAGTIPITVGAGGAQSADFPTSHGKPSSFGSKSIPNAIPNAGTNGGVNLQAYSSRIRGSLETFCGVAPGSGSTTGKGDGGTVGGNPGVVIVRYEIATP